MFSTILVSALALAPQSLPSAPFELNVGAMPSEVAFHAPLAQGTVFVTHEGEVVYAITNCTGIGASLVEHWIDACSAPVGESETATIVNRFQGDDHSSWRTGIPTFERIDLGEVWPGVRVELRADASNVEKLFQLAPHADVANVRVQVRGACSLSVDEDGALVAGTAAGSVMFTAPVAWQEQDGRREPIDVRYIVRDGEYGFALGPYDASRRLWIDPLLQSTFLGGASQDRIDDMQFDAASNTVYVAGQTTSVNFPGTAGGALPTNSGSSDAFVARLSSSLTSLQAATYFGGTGDDRATGIALGTGTIYICGATYSSSLPGSAAGAIPARTGLEDGFVARLSANLSVLHASSFFGGAEPFSSDRANDIAFDAVSSQVVIVGQTTATNLPGTVGSAEPASHGGSDAYVARFSSSLATLITATYVGGNQNDFGNAVVVQAGTGHVFVAGMTDSTDLPAALGVGGAQNSYLGCGFCAAGFVARLNPGLSFTEAVTYYTFPGLLWFEDLAQAPDSTLYAVGPIGPYTGPNLPQGVSGGAQPFPGGEDDSIIARFSGDLAVVLGASYVGGSKSEWGYAVAVDPANGEVLVAGTSTSWNIPGSQGGAQALPFIAPWGGVDDAYVTRLSPNLNVILQSTYFGGTYQEAPRALAVAGAQVLLAGFTGSANMPGRIGGAQATIGGLDDGFVARFDSTLTGPPTGPATYCVAGTSVNGCEALISATANPSATFAGPCSILVAGVDGQRTGAIFYSTQGRAGTAWCPFGGTSVLCMLLPLQRTTPQNSGGTTAACDGTFTLSWNAWHAANPAAPGNFILPGTAIDVQCWHRDPGNCRHTSLSNAVEMTMSP